MAFVQVLNMTGMEDSVKAKSKIFMLSSGLFFLIVLKTEGPKPTSAG